MASRMMDDTTPLPREYYKLVQKSSTDFKSLSTTRPTSFLYQGLWIGYDRCCYLKLMIGQLTCLKHRWRIYANFDFFLTETNILSRCMNLMMITFNKRYKSLRSRQVAL
ncbi:hypothetical protein NC651_019016 [Populus alba x Populus x berolinensis]|nr:hypothetical protein NC651_019016 [Populus alba x Populus x berolinensis]